MDDFKIPDESLHQAQISAHRRQDVARVGGPKADWNCRNLRRTVDSATQFDQVGQKSISNYLQILLSDASTLRGLSMRR